MNDIVGYVMVDKNADITAAVPSSTFKHRPMRVLEFGRDGDNGALIINSEATGIAMIEPEDIVASFKCSQEGDVICPPDLSTLEKMAYVMKATSRKGGYNYLVGQLVIAASLHSKKFNDSILWAKQ
jgi:hypothetical protein